MDDYERLQPIFQRHLWLLRLIAVLMLVFFPLLWAFQLLVQSQPRRVAVEELQGIKLMLRITKPHETANHE